MIQAEWIGKGAPPYQKIGVMIKLPSGDSRQLALQPAVWKNPDGRRVTGFRGETAAEDSGVYQVEAQATWDGGETRAHMKFAVAASAEERRGEAPDAEFLRAIAKQSGGAYFARGQGTQWLKSLPKSQHQIGT
jgi:hypothetical protein